MAKKSSFIMYLDQLAILDELSDAQAGRLFKVIKEYQTRLSCGDLKDVNLDGDQDADTGVDGLLNDSFLRIVFAPFKSHFDRDYEKYASVSRKRMEAGRKGGLRKQENRENVANAGNCKQKLANVANASFARFARNDPVKYPQNEACNTQENNDLVANVANASFASIYDNDINNKRERDYIPPIIPLEEIPEKLLGDTSWKEIICMQSGIGGAEFLKILPGQIELFIGMIKATGAEHTVLTLEDAKRRFFWWWKKSGIEDYRKNGYDERGKNAIDGAPGARSKGGGQKKAVREYDRNDNEESGKDYSERF